MLALYERRTARPYLFSESWGILLWKRWPLRVKNCCFGQLKRAAHYCRSQWLSGQKTLPEEYKVVFSYLLPYHICTAVMAKAITGIAPFTFLFHQHYITEICVCLSDWNAFGDKEMTSRHLQEVIWACRDSRHALRGQTQSQRPSLVLCFSPDSPFSVENRLRRRLCLCSPPAFSQGVTPAAHVRLRDNFYFLSFFDRLKWLPAICRKSFLFCPFFIFLLFHEIAL